MKELLQYAPMAFDFLGGILSSGKKNKKAQRDYQRELVKHHIKETAAFAKWRNTGQENFRQANLKWREATDKIAQNELALWNSMSKGATAIAASYAQATVSGSAAEQGGRRSAVTMTPRAALLKHAAKVNEISAKLSGEVATKSLANSMYRRGGIEAIHAADLNTNAARPGGGHLPQYGGDEPGPSPLGFLFDVGKQFVTGQMNRDNLKREDPGDNSLWDAAGGGYDIEYEMDSSIWDSGSSDSWDSGSFDTSNTFGLGPETLDIKYDSSIWD